MHLEAQYDDFFQIDIFFGNASSMIKARLKIPFLSFSFLEKGQKYNLYAILLVHGFLAQESPKRDV